MAKRSRKRVARHQKDQSSCMWGLISIFDFRQGRSSQKLLPDRKRGSKRIDGAAYANIKLESLTDSCEICKEINETMPSETSTTDTSKMSVKELMEEEMVGEQDQKRHGSVGGGDAKQTAEGDGSLVKKNHRRTKSKMSLDLDAGGFVAAEELVAEKPSHRKHKSCSSADLNIMVEELCKRVQKKDDDHAVQPVENPSVMEKRLGDATKVLVNYFTDGKGCTKDGKIQPSKELTDALQILNSNKEVFLKLLQHPDSQLVKHIHSLQDIQVDEGKLKALTGSDLLGQDIGNSKQHSFFWRRFKGLDRNSSKKSDTSEDLSKIVVLRPGPPSSRNLDMATTCSSLPESPQSTGNKGQIERVSSLFSFAEFKRKLKHAMRKEQHGVSHQPSDDLPNRDKKLGGETVGMASPSRDHFFIERIPKSLVGVKRVDKAGKLKYGKPHLEHETALIPEQRVSNIYIEAKKHLAEIVGNSDVDVDTLGRKVPKSLGRILSFSGYSSPTICSPRNEGEVKLSPNECQMADENTSQVTKEISVGLPDQAKQESENEPCITADKPIHETKVPILEPHISDGPHCESDDDKPDDKPEVPTSEDTNDNVRSPDAESLKETNPMENSFEAGPGQPIMKSDPDNIPSTHTEENSLSTGLGQATCEENEPSSSPNASALVCKMTEKIEDLYTMSDATSRPSPISVLEPLFKEDDISPPGSKYLTADEPIQPRHIQFEEEISAPSEHTPSNRACTCTNDDKYTIEFVKAVVQMSGLTWDDLLRRSLFSDHLIDPSLLDEVDFLPDLLACDFNLLFDLINEVLIDICGLNFGCMLSFATPYVQPELKGKDIFSEIWKGINWYLKLEGPPRTLDQIVANDFAKVGKWMDLQLDRENIGVQMQEAILEELVEDVILSCVTGTPVTVSEFAFLLPIESKDSDAILDV